MKEHDDPLALSALRRIVEESGPGVIVPSTLKTVVRERYVIHSEKLAGVNADAVVVLPQIYRPKVAASIWRDATGRAVAPAVASRTPALKSIGVYISRLAAVATDPKRGVSALRSDSTFDDAESERTNETNIGKNNFKVVAFEIFQDQLTVAERDALQVVRQLLAANEYFADMILNDLKVGVS